MLIFLIGGTPIPDMKRLNSEQGVALSRAVGKWVALVMGLCNERGFDTVYEGI
jgi:hypothetical protein